MALSDALRRVAQTMTKQFGQAATLTSVVATPNPATDSVAKTTVAYPVSVVVTDYSLRDVNEVIQLGDKKVLLAASDLPANTMPAPGWTLTLGSQTYKVVAPAAIGTDSQQVIFILTVRR